MRELLFSVLCFASVIIVAGWAIAEDKVYTNADLEKYASPKNDNIVDEARPSVSSMIRENFIPYSELQKSSSEYKDPSRYEEMNNSASGVLTPICGNLSNCHEYRKESQTGRTGRNIVQSRRRAYLGHSAKGKEIKIYRPCPHGF